MVLRRFLRALALGLFGYGVFGAGAMLYCTVSPHSFPSIDWIEGLLCALPFAASEFLNVGRGRTAGFVRRLLFASATMVVAVLFTIALAAEMGWSTTYERQSQTKGIMNLTCILVFGGALVVVKCVWAGRKKTEASQGTSGAITKQH